MYQYHGVTNRIPFWLPKQGTFWIFVSKTLVAPLHLGCAEMALLTKLNGKSHLHPERVIPVGFFLQWSGCSFKTDTEDVSRGFKRDMIQIKTHETCIIYVYKFCMYVNIKIKDVHIILCVCKYLQSYIYIFIYGLRKVL